MEKRQNSLARWAHGTAITLAVSILLVVTATAQTAAASAKRNDAQVVKDFEVRVNHYLEARKKQTGEAAQSTASPKKLEDTQQAVTDKSKSTRDGAKQGDIFSPDIAQYFRRQISATLAGPQGARIRVSLHHAEPVHDLPLHVNEKYPGPVPLQSTPPSLLLNLPPLPKDLQYRIVGHSLMLLDVTPKLIVDFIPNAIPSDKD